MKNTFFFGYTIIYNIYIYKKDIGNLSAVKKDDFYLSLGDNSTLLFWLMFLVLNIYSLYLKKQGKTVIINTEI